MMPFIKNLVRRLGLFFGFLINSLRLITVLASFLTLLGLSGLVYGIFQKITPVIIGGVIVTLISLLIFLLVFTALEPLFRQINTSTAKSFGFEILEKRLSYRYLEDGQTMDHDRHYKVQPMLDGLISFTDKYTWTGTGKCELSVLEPGYELSHIRQVDEWTFFDVILPKPTKKGEEIEFTVHWDLFDEHKTAVPFLSTIVDRPTHKIVMRVVLPSNLKPKHILFFDYPDTATWMPEQVLDGNFDPITREIRYEISDPKYQHKYLISWRT